MRSVTLWVIVLFLATAGCRQDGQSPAVRAPFLDSGATLPPQNLPVAGPVRAELTPIAVPAFPSKTANAAPWPLSLDQAIVVALQRSDVVRVLDGGEVFNGTATSYDAAIADQAAQVALAAFDTTFGANFYWNRINQPPDAILEPGVLNPGRYDAAGLTFGFTKTWLTGGQTRVSYNPPTGYIYFPNGETGFNPTHTANIELSVRQPLLRGAGQEFNSAPIVVARIRASQSAWDFKASMLEFVRSVEQAYWELTSAQIALGGIEEQLPLIDEVVRIEQASLQAKRAIPADVAKARAQRHAFRQRKLQMQSLIAEREIHLRRILGVEPNVGGDILPVTAPSHAPLVVDPQATLATAIDHRPDLLRQRLSVRIRELELIVAHNSLLPQFDLQALYRTTGVAEQLGNALSMMGTNEYGDWQFGATFSVPLGRNAGKAHVRAAELQKERELALLQQNVQGVAYQLANIMQRIALLHQQCAEADSRAQECQEWLRGARVRYQIPLPNGEGGNWLLQALDDYLLAMRTTADATAEAGDLWARYNTELARLQEATGMLLDNIGICISEDPTRKLTVTLQTAIGSGPSVALPPSPAEPVPGGNPPAAPAPAPSYPPAAPAPAPAYPLGPAGPPVQPLLGPGPTAIPPEIPRPESGPGDLSQPSRL